MVEFVTEIERQIVAFVNAVDLLIVAIVRTYNKKLTENHPLNIY